MVFFTIVFFLLFQVVNIVLDFFLDKHSHQLNLQEGKFTRYYWPHFCRMPKNFMLALNLKTVLMNLIPSINVILLSGEQPAFHIVDNLGTKMLEVFRNSSEFVKTFFNFLLAPVPFPQHGK